MKKRLLLLIFVMLIGCNVTNAKELHTEIYEVKEGDTLTSIAQKFITSDRFLPEFEEGIYELNYDVMHGIKKVEKGQILEINYWR